jgi:hypothetical protein
MQPLDPASAAPRHVDRLGMPERTAWMRRLHLAMNVPVGLLYTEFGDPLSMWAKQLITGKK